jgi:hypothetical protein
MTRRLMSMAVALAAVVALSAVVASGAQAVEYFHSKLGTVNPDSVIITGTATDHVFKDKPEGGAELVCKNDKAEGTQEVTITQKEHEDKKIEGTFTHTNATGVKTLTSTGTTLTTTLSGCTISGIEATVTTTGCHVRLTAETNGGMAPLHTECDTGKKVIISGGGCTVEIGSQSPGGGVVYTETEGGEALNAETHVTGVSYTATGFACALLGIKSGSTGETSVTFLGLKGYEDKTKTPTGTYDEGKQVGIWKGPTK